ncbi:MAG: hypothetical protein WC299_05760 [Kiritimatiellia bacterium]
MKFFKCIPAGTHAVKSGNKQTGRVAEFDGLAHNLYLRMPLGYGKSGWYVGWQMGQILLSNCRDTTWIALSPSLTHIWHVDRAGTVIAFQHGGTFHLMFTDGFLVDIEDKDLEEPHKWGNFDVLFSPDGYLRYFIFDNPKGQLHVFNINELHLLAAILARTNQHEYYRRLRQKR